MSCTLQFLFVILGISDSWGWLVEVLFRWGVHKMVNNAVHHDHLGGLTSALECLPLELLEHRCDAAPVLVVSGDKSFVIVGVAR
jgi:hypothetical protein